MATTHRSVNEYLDSLDEAALACGGETTPKFASKSEPPHSGPELQGYTCFA